MGEVGDGSTTPRHSPVPVSGLTNIVAVKAGMSHALALRSDGTVWAWGGNEAGQLGDGTTAPRSTPVRARDITNVVRVAAGAHHSLAVKTDGTMWTWGWNPRGQLGDGTATTNRRVAAQVGGLGGVAAVAGGFNHSLAVSPAAVEYLRPTIGSTAAAITGVEGASATLTGLYHHAGRAQTVTLTASAGTVTKTGSHSGDWTWSFTPADGPADSRTVTITATDAAGGTATTTFALTVHNASPTATLSGRQMSRGSSAAAVTLTDSSDPSTADAAAGFHYAFACDNGSLDGATYASSGAAASTTCTFDGSGSYAVRGRIIDRDEGYSEYQTTVRIELGPSRLAITGITPAIPIVGEPFSVTVTALDDNGTVRPVEQATAVSLSAVTGTGTLSGATAGTIPAGAGSVTLGGLTYDIGDVGIVLRASAAGGDDLGAGDSAPFTVTAQAPLLGSLSPAQAHVLTLGFALQATGSHFTPASVLRWNGQDRPTIVMSSTQLQAAIAETDIAAQGTADVTVFTPSPGGGTSTALTFTIVNPLPRIRSIEPGVVTRGGGPFTLTLTGAGFVPGVRVLWNGSARETTIVDRFTLTAEIPASDLAVASVPLVVHVTVDSPAPGGGESESLLVTIVSADTGAAQSSAAAAGSVATASTAPGEPGTAGASAELTNTGGSGLATVTALTYTGNPTGVGVFDVGGGFVDVQAVGAVADLGAQRRLLLSQHRHRRRRARAPPALLPPGGLGLDRGSRQRWRVPGQGHHRQPERHRVGRTLLGHVRRDERAAPERSRRHGLHDGTRRHDAAGNRGRREPGGERGRLAQRRRHRVLERQRRGIGHRRFQRLRRRHARRRHVRGGHGVDVRRDQRCRSRGGRVGDAETLPVIDFTGQGTYSVDQTVRIACSATDALSGIDAAHTTCHDTDADAWTFAPGDTVVHATARDLAGNEAVGSVTVSVRVTFDGLRSLVGRFVAHRGRANSLEAKLNAAEKARNLSARIGVLNAFVQEVQALLGRDLDRVQATALIRLARAL